MVRVGGMGSYSVNLSVLLSGLCTVPDELDVVVQDIKIDSRKIQKGDLFVSLSGSELEAQSYIDEAVNKGACAVLSGFGSKAPYRNVTNEIRLSLPELSSIAGLIISRFFKDPSKDIVVLGVTGTNGKTSVSHYIAQLLAENGVKAAVIGTMGVGFPGSQMEETGYTTPDVVEVHRHLAQMRDMGAEAVAMEVSSHGLEQGRVDGVAFTGAVFTNLTRDHLDYHGSMEQYGNAKAKLFKIDSLKFAILNSEDDFSQSLADVLPDTCSVVFYGEKGQLGESDLRLMRASYGVKSDIELVMCGDQLASSLSLVGRFNVLNAVAATAVLTKLDRCLSDIKGLGSLSPVPGRMNIYHAQGKPVIVVDYAHTPDALANILQAVKGHCQGDLLLVFGCGGDRDKGKRPEMAKVAEELATQIMVTSDNPRTESPESIVNDIFQGFMRPDSVLVEYDRSKAIAQMFAQATEEDWLVVAGKGHETYQEINGERLPFSDLSIASSLLAGSFGGEASLPAGQGACP